MSPPLLQAAGLTKTWDGHRVLDGLDLDLAAGEHTLVQGPSGAGKSTLLALLARLAEPDAGTIQLHGQDIRALGDPAAYRRRHIGIIFQEVLLIDGLTLLQNIEMVSINSPRPGPSPASLLEPLGLADRAGTRAAVLSRGERQRVALARAFAAAPHVVLADEPTASLDPGNRDRTLDQLFTLAAAVDATVLVVSHDAALAARPELSRRLILDGGRLHEQAQ